MLYDLIIKNGLVVTPSGLSKSDIIISNEVIHEIVSNSEKFEAKRYIDAQGCYVLPGGVDPHVHTKLPLGGFVSLDNFYESSTAAAKGGNTTFVDFAIPQPQDVSPVKTFQDRIEEIKGDGVKIDVNLHAGLTSVDDNVSRDVKELEKLGAKTFKMFTVYRNQVMLSLDEIWKALNEIANVQGMAVIHAESNHIIEESIQKYVKEGLTTPKYHPLSRPGLAEVDAVQSVIDMLKATKGAAYFVHISTPEALDLIHKEHAKGVDVWAETCPHYLVLDDKLYSTVNGERFICSPPLRSSEQAYQLWDGLTKGKVSIIGSDHSAYDTYQKAQAKNDFTIAPNGLPGIETRLPIMFSEGVMNGRLTIEQFAKLTSTNPAKLNGLYPKKGTIQVGSDADLTIYNPNVSYRIDSKNLLMKTDYTPFQGMKINGRVEHVIARGDIVVENHEFVGDDHQGHFIPSGATKAP